MWMVGLAKELKKLENGTFNMLFHKAELPIYAESTGEIMWQKFHDTVMKHDIKLIYFWTHIAIHNVL